MLRARLAKAFAPATITNFFAVHYKPKGDLLHSGATGGGYILSRGAVSKVAVVGSDRISIDTVVNGDASYEARTTRSALSLLMKESGITAKLKVEQQVDVPIGYGFGASAASALSAVLAGAAALELDLPKERVAQFAHRAEILQRTGLGTVSAAYDGVGAGVVYEPGAPGFAKFRNVEAGPDVRIVTASVSPMKLGPLLSADWKIGLINRFGGEALRRVMAEPTLERMALEGESFTRKVRIATKEVASLVRAAKRAGASFASQNMVGQAMHAVVPVRRTDAVVTALKASPSEPRVDVLEIGRVKAGVTSIAEMDYPTVTSSLA